MPVLDDLCPNYVRGKLISLSPANPLDPPRAFQPVDILVALTGLAATSGLILPVEVSVTSPSSADAGTLALRHVFRRVLPERISFTPKEGGPHLVRVRELGHNLWYGVLAVDVAGERLLPA